VLVLGIESSCDETGAAIVHADGTVLADVVQGQVATHAPYGGVVPELASRDHLTNVDYVVRAALEKANVKLSDLHGIAATRCPGLVGGLLVGLQVAKGLAFGTGLPFVGVDHLVGHLLAAFLQRGKDEMRPAFPFVALLASGGHTALYRVDGPLVANIHELGATRDDAAGEAFDKVAKLLGLGYPGGPLLDRLAKEGDPKRCAFHGAKLAGYEFSFSGLKSNVARWREDQGETLAPQLLRDACAGFQASVVKALTEKLFAAVDAERVSHVVLGGGVAANSALRARTREMAENRSIHAHLPELANCTDNAAMIAYAGAQRLLAGERDDLGIRAESKTALPRRTRKGGGKRA